MASLLGLSGIEKTSPVFRWKLVAMANDLGADPDYFAAVIKFESGFDPARPNAAGSGATGLIQFTRETAEALGTSTADLARMTAEDQLEYVHAYFAPYRGRMHSLADVYLAVFYPAAIGKPSDHVIANASSTNAHEVKVYQQNAQFDREGKGYITVGDVVRTITEVYNAGLLRPRVDVPSEAPTMGPVEAGIDRGAVVVLVVAASIYGLVQRFLSRR